jgi:opacity protein-like surface antigen
MAFQDKPTIAAILALCGLTIAGAVPLVCHADDMTPPAADVSRIGGLVEDARALWHEGTSRLEGALSGVRHKARRNSPDWLQRRSGTDPLEFAAPPEGEDTRLVLQEDRPDGADLVTVRYAFDDTGAFRTYAGAGMNRAVYFMDGADPAPSLMSRRNRRSSIGAAAELGAELRVSEHLALNADLRWFDLDDRANALRSDAGPVGADPVMLGLTVGYRFR